MLLLVVMLLVSVVLVVVVVVVLVVVVVVVVVLVVVGARCVSRICSGKNTAGRVERRSGCHRRLQRPREPL